MTNFKIKERHIERVYHNPKIGQWLDSLNDQRDKEVAARTIDFIKREFPEVRDVLNGELVFEEISNGHH